MPQRNRLQNCLNNRHLGTVKKKGVEDVEEANATFPIGNIYPPTQMLFLYKKLLYYLPHLPHLLSQGGRILPERAGNQSVKEAIHARPFNSFIQSFLFMRQSVEVCLGKPKV